MCIRYLMCGTPLVFSAADVISAEPFSTFQHAFEIIATKPKVNTNLFSNRFNIIRRLPTKLVCVCVCM